MLSGNLVFTMIYRMDTYIYRKDYNVIPNLKRLRRETASPQRTRTRISQADAMT